MFNKPTVFILGAGASWHYGYPTGEKLVADAIAEATALANHYDRWGIYREFFTDHAKYHQQNGASDPSAAAAKDCRELAVRLQAFNPTVIDYFLGQNPALQDVGRFIIALVILKAEARYVKSPHNLNRKYDLDNSPDRNERTRQIDISKFKDDWCRFVIYQWATGSTNFEELKAQKVTFVTFNYDTSLERRIEKGFKAIELFERGDMNELITSERVMHVYGQAGSYRDDPIELLGTPSDFNSVEGGDHMRRFISMLNAAYAASKNIKTIDPHYKESNEEVLTRARNAVAEASTAYVLGYGFDQNNNDRLGLNRSLSPQSDRSDPQIFFTNLNNSERVNQRASLLFFRLPNVFRSGLSHHGLCQKSTRDVYSAFDLDFEQFG